jgi:cytoskeletal protein CcmA (bactofilin family)
MKAYMFKKSNNDKLESLIGSNSGFRGNVEVKGTLRVDGTIEGNITADHVIIGKDAYVKGNVDANAITIGGKMEGNIHASGLVEITSAAFALGDIIAKRISISEGGIFNGRIIMKEDETSLLGYQANS